MLSYAEVWAGLNWVSSAYPMVTTERAPERRGRLTAAGTPVFIILQQSVQEWHRFLHAVASGFCMQ